MRQAFDWLNQETRDFLNKGYLQDGVVAEDRLKEIALHAEHLLQIKGFGEKFYDYLGKGYFSLSSPVWSNFGNDKGLPISCFGSLIEDSIESLVSTVAEVGTMSKYGGGTSAYFGKLRPRGSEIKLNGKSEGSFHFTKLFDTTIDVISQGNNRRGMFAGYIDIEHEDIEEWLDIHTEGNPIQLMYYGVCVGHDWLMDMKNGDSEKRRIWAKVLQRRNETGIPYLFFKDNANRFKPEVYKNMPIYSSNLCSEIMLPTTEDESFVCCLASMNLLHYDEWKHTDAVETLTYFLDSVMTEFINKAKNIKHLERAVKFAERHRALGIGVLGWHSYLQKNFIAFDAFEAMEKNNEIFSFIKERSYKASEELAELFGEPEVLKGYGRRNTTTMAIAPTKSSSFIHGQVSPSVEPYKNNFHIKDLAKSKSVYKNPFLKTLLEEKGKNNDEVWESILFNNGSVQHLEFLSLEEKRVFKTFEEISQLTILQQAAQRQKYIDQSQSINLMIHPKTETKEINRLYLLAEEMGLKSLYYQFSVNAAQDLNRSLLSCSSCQS